MGERAFGQPLNALAAFSFVLRLKDIAVAGGRNADAIDAALDLARTAAGIA